MDETTGEVKMNLRQKLAAIRREIHNVEKTGENTFHNYKYVTASDMAGILGTALAKADIIVSRRNMKVTRILENPYPDRPEKAEVVVSIECEYGFLDCDSTEEIWAPSYGEGRDKGDKGGFKAHTGALKYFLIQAFLLATGDDPENSSKEDEERNRPVARTQTPPPALRAVGSTEYVPRSAIENLVAAANRKMGEGVAMIELKRWSMELGCTRDTTTTKQLGELTLRVAEWREPGDEPLSTDIDAALGTVEETMDRVGQQSNDGVKISVAQGKRLYAIAKGNKQLLKDTLAQFGFEHDRDIPKGARYDAICKALEAAQVGDAPQDSPDIEW